MLKSFGALHKLRVLNFDYGDKKNGKTLEKKNSKQSHFNTQNLKKNLKSSTNGLIGKCSKWVKTKSSSETSFKERSLRKTRFNSIFKRQSNQSNIPIAKRSVSLYNLKQNFSSTNFLLKIPIKSTFKTNTEKSLKRKQDKHDNYNKTDVQVLFMSETRKPNRRLKKPNFCEDSRKLDWINNSKSSSILNFKSNQQYANKNYEPYKNNNRVFRNFNHNNENVCKFEQNRKILNDRSISLNAKSYGNTVPVQYNLVDFSCASCQIKGPYNECIHKVSTIDPCPCVNKQVWVTTPCLDICRNASKDNFSYNVTTRKATACNTDCKNNVNQVKGKGIKSCVNKQQINIPVCLPNLIKKPQSTAHIFLKYFFFVIGLIVWSPCILMHTFYWVVTYPARTSNFLKKTSLFTAKECGLRFGCKKYCFRSLLNVFLRFSLKVNYIFRALKHRTEKQRSEEFQHLKPCVLKSDSKTKCFTKKLKKLSPDPKNKYTLYYTPHRGWIIKALKNKGQYVNKRCGCHIKDTKEEKIMRDQDSECRPEKIRDKNTFKTMKSRRLSNQKITDIKKFHKRSRTVPNVSDNLLSFNKPDCNACCKKIIAVRVPQPTPDLSCIRNPEVIQKRSLEQCPEKCTKILKIKTRKNVSFNGIPAVDLSDLCSPEIMSPQLMLQNPFNLNAFNERCSPKDSCHKIIKVRSHCSCQNKKKAPTPIHYTFKRPTAYKQKPIYPKYTRATINVKPSGPIIRKKYLNRKYEVKGRKRLTYTEKVYCWYKTVRKNLGRAVHEVENDVWKSFSCREMYIHTLRRKPWFWVHQRCPSFYPYFLIFYKFYENVVTGLVFIISTCVWVPIFIWCYICFSLFCRCLKC